MQDNYLIEILNKTDIDIIHSITNTYPNAKDIFMSDETMIIPPSRYDYLNIEIVKKNIDTLENTSINSTDFDEDWQYLLFEDLIIFSLEKNKFLYLNYIYNNSDDIGKHQIADEFYHYDKALFGVPDQDEFHAILFHTLSTIKEKKLNKDDSRMYDELIDLLPVLPDKTHDIFRPSNYVLSMLHNRTTSFYDRFLRHIPEKERFELNEICDITNEILNEEFSYCKGKWQVIFDKDRSFASVNQQSREIIFPGKRNIPYYTRDSLIELIVHEVGVHFLRELPFDSVNFELLRTGLRGYETVEEGIALNLSQSVINSFRYPGLMHYTTIGLAYFYNKTFREVYEIQKRLQYLADGTPFGKSYDSVNRAFRGTYELVNFKDLAYYNGAMKVWLYISEHIDDPKLFDTLLFSGKTDIFNHDQQIIIEEVKKSYSIKNHK